MLKNFKIEVEEGYDDYFDEKVITTVIKGNSGSKLIVNNMGGNLNGYYRYNDIKGGYGVDFNFEDYKSIIIELNGYGRKYINNEFKELFKVKKGLLVLKEEILEEILRN